MTTTTDKEPMKVFLRIRPFLKNEEINKENQGCIQIKGGHQIELVPPEDSFVFKSGQRIISDQSNEFTFTQVFNEETTQKDFFDGTMLSFVEDILDGQNGLVFSYGVTNSGKTYTIQGKPSNGGVLPRSLDVIFNSIGKNLHVRNNMKPTLCQDVAYLNDDEEGKEESLKRKILNALQNDDTYGSLFNSTSNSTNIEDISRVSDTNRLERLSAVEEEIRQRVTDNTSLCLNNKQGGNATYAVWISFMEIYNEFIYDLLDPQLIVRGKKRQNLKLGDDKRGNPYVKDLKHVMVTSSDEAYKVLRLGQGNRHMAATKLNQASSRSHSIFTIKILKIENNDHVTRVSRLSIVDLAGSERYCKTQAGNNRLKEASNINSSIMTLGQCINALRYNQTHPSQTIVPFRESKLTRLFQSFFLGKGKTAMIVNISQCASVFDETMNVMRFSAVAKHVKTKAGRTTELYKVVEKLPPPLSTPSRQRLTRPFIATPAATPSGNSKRTLNDPTAFSYDELVSIVGELRDKVKKERVENLQMESKLRKEIGSDFNKLCEQMGRDHQERLSEQKDRLETLMEKRLENMSKLVETLHKNDQRDRDEQFVSVAQYENERIKVQTRDATIRDLKERMDKFQPRDLLNDSSTEVEVERLETELGEAQRKLSEARDCLAMHMKEMERMQQKLQDKDDEIERLLDEQQVSQEEKDDSMKDADHDKSKLIEELKEMLARVTEELENHRKEAQEQAETTNQTFSAHESLKVDHEDLIKIAEKHKEWYEIMKEKNALITSEKGEFERLYQESEAKLKEVTTKWEGAENGSRELKESVQTMQFENDENAIKVERYEALVKEHRSALADSEAIVEQLNKEKEANEQTIAQLKTDLEVKAVEYERYAEEKCDFEATINSLHQQVDKLREEADKNLNNQKQVTDELYNELERKNEDFEKLLQDKVVLVEQLNIDLDSKNKEIEKLTKEKALVDELNIDLENKKQEVEDLTKEKTNMDATVVQLRSEMEELRQLSLKNPPTTESKPVMLERQQQQISDVVSMEALRAKLTPKKTPMKNMTPKKTPKRVMTPLRQATPTTTPRSRLNNEASTSKMNTLLRETATALEAKTSHVYELEAKLKDVESKMAGQISKSKVESQLSELKTRCTDLTAEIATEKSKYQSLLTELNSEKEKVNANEKLHEGKVKSLTAELREAKEKLELTEESSEKMSLQLQRATEENEKFREKERSVRKELEERRKSRFVFEQTTSSCIEELKEDSNQIKKSMFKETAKLEEENVELAHELLEVKKLNDQLEIELTSEKSSHEKCQSDIKQLQTELQLAETLKNKLKMRTENLEYRFQSMEKEKNLENQNQLESVASRLAESKRNHTQVVQQLKEAAEKISKQDTNIQIHLEKILLLEEQLKSTTTTSGEEDKENRASRNKRRVTRQNSQCDDEDEEAGPTKKSKAKPTPKKKYGLRSKPSSNLQEPVIDDDSLEESMVLVTSIACSPVREELTNHIAVGEVVAVRCDDVAEQPLLGEVAGKADDTLSLRVMTGGYTRVWRVKPNEEARDFSVHDVILAGIRLLNSRRLPAEVKHSLQSLYDTQN